MQGQPPRSHVVALAYDGLCTFEFGCAYEIFGLPRPELDRPWYRSDVCAAEPGPLQAAGGLAVEAPYDLDLIERAGTVGVPGWRDAAEPPLRERLGTTPGEWLSRLRFERVGEVLARVLGDIRDSSVDLQDDDAFRVQLVRDLAYFRPEPREDFEVVRASWPGATERATRHVLGVRADELHCAACRR